MRFTHPSSGGSAPETRSTAQTPSSSPTSVGFRAVPGPNVPFPPMEAQPVKELPDSNGWQFEPKWDGFRGVLENARRDLALWARHGRALLRYFPAAPPLGDLLPPRSALDGEAVISGA